MLPKGYKEIFIAVAGGTPQIITETIYALAVKDPPVILDEIYIITTSEGKRNAKEALVERGILKALLNEYGLTPVELKDDSFVLVKDQYGKELDDIRTEADNELLAECILQFMREKAADPSVRLHCSIAGGRKTMSYYLGAIVQMLGRPWDRLYHVLVSTEFETNPQFFFKPKKNVVIECKGKDGAINKRLNTDDAEILVEELPYIRLGGKLSLQGKGFKELVEEGQRDIDASLHPLLCIDLKAKAIHIGSITIDNLTAMQLMLYAFLVRQKIEYCRLPEREYCVDCTECYLPLNYITAKPSIRVMVSDYTAIHGGNIETVKDKIQLWLDKGIKEKTILPIKTNINDEIIKVITDKALQNYCKIESIRKYRNTRYGIKIEKGKIQIK